MRTTKTFLILFIGLFGAVVAQAVFHMIPELQHPTPGDGVFVLYSGEHILTLAGLCMACYKLRQRTTRLARLSNQHA